MENHISIRPKTTITQAEMNPQMEEIIKRIMVMLIMMVAVAGDGDGDGEGEGDGDGDGDGHIVP